MTSEGLAVLQPYCENDMRLLKKMSKSIFMKYNEPLAKADYDEFYSIANMTLWKAYNAYKPETGVSFDIFLRACLKKKFATEIQARHRHKRLADRFAVSLDARNTDGEEYSLMEYMPSDFDTFEEVAKRQENGQYRDRMQQYISKLSNQQVNILNLLIDGYKPNEIRRILEISKNEYADSLSIMRSYENVKILF